MTCSKALKITVLILFFINSISSLAFSFQAVKLSDSELDSIFVGGFDFDLNAAYAFRAAVVSQSNIAAIACLNSQGSNTAVINSTNQAVLKNAAGPASAQQRNISTVVAHSGDLVNSVINNSNIADIVSKVLSVFIEDSGFSSETPVETQLVPTVNSIADQLTSTAGHEVADEAINTALLTSPFEPAVLTEEVPPVVNALEAPVDTVPTSECASGPAMEHNTIVNSSVSQTNIAAVIAMDGNVDSTKINNLNVVNVENEGAPAAATQTNIAIVIAKGVVGNTEIANNNIANVVDSALASVPDVAKIVSQTFKGAFADFKIEQIVNNKTQASQTNITIIKSLGENIKQNVAKSLNSMKFIKIH